MLRAKEADEVFDEAFVVVVISTGYSHDPDGSVTLLYPERKVTLMKALFVVHLAFRNSL